MSKVILLSQFALPYSNIGSWTTLYANYITHHKHQIDHIICPRPNATFDQIEYGFIHVGAAIKIRRKFIGKDFKEYLRPLAKIVKPDQKYIIQIIDNYGLAPALHAFLIKNNLRKNCHIQYFHHGFAQILDNKQSNSFFNSIDELVLLTHDSYRYMKDYHTVLPCRVSVLYNGIDSSKFRRLESNDKTALKETLGFAGKTVFLWCSQDRPKKGLKLVLEAWKQLYSPQKNMVLLVIGVKTPVVQDGVVSVGRMPNAQLPQYFQSSDVYLFPTLCKEGFPLTVLEALHCGNYCIASALGGVPEVLQYGKLGKLIHNPHYVNEWVSAITEYLSDRPSAPEMPAGLYSMEAWNTGMDQIITDAKVALER